MDLELTCWEDSLRTDWADPARPPEIIEVGMAVYDVATRAVGRTFTTLVRPHVNPTLSAYCVELVHVTQTAVDGADDLAAAFAQLEDWLAAVPARFPTVAWGELDRRRMASNVAMRGLVDPLTSRAHVDLCAVMTALVGHPTPVDRDALRAMKGLPPNPHRHRALADALDLTHFLAVLFDRPPAVR